MAPPPTMRTRFLGSCAVIKTRKKGRHKDSYINPSQPLDMYYEVSMIEFDRDVIRRKPLTRPVRRFVCKKFIVRISRCRYGGEWNDD